MDSIFWLGISFAQDSVRGNTSTDSKVRNIDGVAAVVNTGFVTRKEIDDRIATLKKQGVKLPDDGSLRKTILERLIIEKVSGKTYGQNEKETYAFRVILDHLRGATFLISDNVHPSNKDQGYFVRRLIRRSVRRFPT